MSGIDVNLTNLAPPLTPDGAFVRAYMATAILGQMAASAAVDSGRTVDRATLVTAAVILADALILKLAGPPPVASGPGFL